MDDTDSVTIPQRPRNWGQMLSGIRNACSPTERAFLYFLIVIALGSGLLLLERLNERHLIEVPASGGTLTEGVVGSPRFINPLLAVSDSDRDLTKLVYSGLMRALPNGDLIPDLAEDYRISDDGTVYTFTLRDNATFHDGMSVTADDIVFTVTMTQNSLLKSPARANWDGVIVQKVDDKTVEFILPRPYAPFLANTILGILPKHIWGEVSVEQFPFSQFNIKPIGSGPFQVADIKRNKSGLPESYTLSSFSDFTLHAPYLSSIVFRFYPNEDALVQGYRSGEIDALNSISPANARALEDEGANVRTQPLPRIFGVFFNQNRADIFADQAVRQALALAVPKNRIVDEVLEGYATTINGPIPPGILPDNESNSDTETMSNEERLDAARAILADDGWAMDDETGVLTKEVKKGKTKTLTFSISTSNTIELKSVAAITADAWKQLGARIDLRFFETSDLNQNVIRPRSYDTLLFGEIVGRELDLFSFWHSSQQNDPGLNIALYANITTDKLLEEARSTTDRDERNELYQQFESELEKETPAIFLYAPLFIYVVPNDLHNLDLGPITTPSERFSNVYEWYMETERIWPIFNR